MQHIKDAVVAQSFGDWTEKCRVPGSSLSIWRCSVIRRRYPNLLYSIQDSCQVAKISNDTQEPPWHKEIKFTIRKRANKMNVVVWLVWPQLNWWGKKQRNLIIQKIIILVLFIRSSWTGPASGTFCGHQEQGSERYSNGLAQSSTYCNILLVARKQYGGRFIHNAH